MKHFVPLLLASAVVTVCAQSVTKTAATPRASTAPRPATASAAATTLPPGIPRVHGIVKSAFALRYEDLKPGTGAFAEPNKMYKINYTGWVASDGRKFDSTDDHRLPLRDKDGKPILGDDGKPKLGDPQPFGFAQGFGRVIPGFDQGFDGMRIGGKRRLFIPWQLAYGAHGRPGPDPAHPGIPPKADLIFDVELVDVTDLPMPQGRPGVGAMPGVQQRPGMTSPASPPPAGAAANNGRAMPVGSEKPAASAQPAGSVPASGSTAPSSQTAVPDPSSQPTTPPQPKPQQ